MKVKEFRNKLKFHSFVVDVKKKGKVFLLSFKKGEMAGHFAIPVEIDAIIKARDEFTSGKNRSGKPLTEDQFWLSFCGTLEQELELQLTAKLIADDVEKKLGDKEEMKKVKKRVKAEEKKNEKKVIKAKQAIADEGGTITDVKLNGKSILK